MDKSPPDNKLPRIIEEIIVKYAVDANLTQTHPKKNPAPGFYLLLYRGLIVGGFCPGAFCRGAFDLEPLKIITLLESIYFENV